MNATEKLNSIVKLLGLSFKKEKFFTTVLKDGETTVTNNLEDEIAVGHTLYIVGEATLIPAPAGEHITREGLVITVDEESTVVKIESEIVSEESPTEDVVETSTDEAVEQVVEDQTEDDFKTQIGNLKYSIEQLLSVVDSMNGKFKTDLNTLRSDFETFKNSPERKPVEVKQSFKDSFEDYRVNVLKSIRNK